jgi:hypothetical protein
MRVDRKLNQLFRFSLSFVVVGLLHMFVCRTELLFCHRVIFWFIVSRTTSIRGICLPSLFRQFSCIECETSMSTPTKIRGELSDELGVLEESIVDHQPLGNVREASESSSMLNVTLTNSLRTSE